MEQEATGIDTWAVIELMGHRQVAGHVSEYALGGQVLLRIDVPTVAGWPEHTKYFGPGGIYAIHPCSEEIARQAAERIATQWGHTPMPVSVPDLARAGEELRQLRAAREEADYDMVGG